MKAVRHFSEALRADIEERFGDGPTKCYTIVPGAQLALKTPRDYQREAAEATQRTNLAGIKLHAILDNITRTRLAA